MLPKPDAPMTVSELSPFLAIVLWHARISGGEQEPELIFSEAREMADMIAQNFPAFCRPDPKE